MTELQILSAIKNNNGNINYVDLLNLGLTDSIRDPLADRDLIRQLIRTNVLSGSAEAHGTIAFGKNGRLRLRELEKNAEDAIKHAKDHAEERRNDKRHDWTVALVSVAIGAILGSICTLLSQLLT